MIYHPRIRKVLTPLTQPWEFSGIALTRSFYSSLFFIALSFQKKTLLKCLRYSEASCCSHPCFCFQSCQMWRQFGRCWIINTIVCWAHWAFRWLSWKPSCTCKHLMQDHSIVSLCLEASSLDQSLALRKEALGLGLEGYGMIWICQVL